MNEKYVWKHPDPTAAELRRFVERDFGKYFINALQDVGVALDFMSPLETCWPVAEWLKRIEKLAAIPQHIKEKFLDIDETRLKVISFPCLSRRELDDAKENIMDVMNWMRNKFPTAGVEYYQAILEAEDWAMSIVPTIQEMENSIIGKKVVALSWNPVPNLDGLFGLEAIILEGGLKLVVWASDYGNIVSAEIEELNHAD